jgi:hypothetical protein
MDFPRTVTWRWWSIFPRQQKIDDADDDISPNKGSKQTKLFCKYMLHLLSTIKILGCN